MKMQFQNEIKENVYLYLMALNNINVPFIVGFDFVQPLHCLCECA